MKRLTIRIRQSTHEILHDLAAKSGLPMIEIVDEAVRNYQRKIVWEAFDASCASLKANPETLASYHRETLSWEPTLGDGLDRLPK